MNSSRRSGFKIMCQLIGLVKSLIAPMLIAISFGVIGFLCAIFITILGVTSIIKLLPDSQSSFLSNISLNAIIITIIVIAILRGIFHYIEQYCNHFIAFRLLAIIRHRVFNKLRSLSPAKLEGKDKGNLITIITSDVELLEVFYAHTISPIAIAFLTSLIMVIFIGNFNYILGIIALISYCIIGIAVPMINSKFGGNLGFQLRNAIGKLSSMTLESIYAVGEFIQYDYGTKQNYKISKMSESIADTQRKLSNIEGTQQAITNLLIMLLSLTELIIALFLYKLGLISFGSAIIASIALISSFGPVIALSNLSNNLNQTLASGERILSLLEEEPQIYDVIDGKKIDFENISTNNLSFAYDNELILKDLNINISKNSILGIHGPSGCGKSTLLKLFMRFWNVTSGSVNISGTNINEIDTAYLRDIESYVTQETWLFQDTIANNVRIGKLDATEEEIIKACKMASIHEFIISLPKGYDTMLSELGNSLSGGERQRLGIARGFLHDSPIFLLDEPTSSLDALNEGIILKAIKESSKDKTIVIVSHRDSTLKICDNIIEMQALLSS